MAKKKNKKQFPKLLAAIIILACVGLIFLFLPKKTKNIDRQLHPYPTQNNQVKTHTSQDLKISFEYPMNWYIHEKDRSILVASYPTHIGENSRPNNDQIKMFIDEYSEGCYREIENNLIDPACGRGIAQSKNQIVSKEVFEKGNVAFYKYTVKKDESKQTIFYFFQKKNSDLILQISKEPDPSQFEKEFEEIIGSLKLLD